MDTPETKPGWCFGELFPILRRETDAELKQPNPLRRAYDAYVAGVRAETEKALSRWASEQYGTPVRVTLGESSTYDATQGACVTRAMMGEIAEPCPVCENIAHREAFEAETGLKTKPPMFPVCPVHGREPEADKPVEVVG